MKKRKRVAHQRAATSSKFTDYVHEEDDVQGKQENETENETENENEPKTTITWLGEPEETNWCGIDWKRGVPVELSSIDEDERESLLAQVKRMPDKFKIDEPG